MMLLVVVVAGGGGGGGAPAAAAADIVVKTTKTLQLERFVTCLSTHSLFNKYIIYESEQVLGLPGHGCSEAV